MRRVWPVLLVGCRLGSPDPVVYLDWYGYSLVPPGLTELPMPTAGPGVCPSGNRAFEATATRKPVPEENPCTQIKAKVIICCPVGGRRCYGREKEVRCEIDDERYPSFGGGN